MESLKHLGIAYAMKKRNAQKLFKGGSVHGKHSFKSGEKGIHEPTTSDPGESYAGHEVSEEQELKRNGSREEGIEHHGMAAALAKSKHEKVLAEMKAMKKPNLYAEGGMIENEDEHPMHEDLNDIETADIDHEHAGFQYQEHEDLAEPEESRFGLPKNKHITSEPSSGEVRLSDKKESAFFNKGGMIDKVLARRMASGGIVGEEGRPEGDESIDNFGHEEHQDNDFLSAEEQTPFNDLNEDDESERRSRMNLDPKQDRKQTIMGIMRGLHKGHFGR